MVAPFSQMLEPPSNPGRFTTAVFNLIVNPMLYKPGLTVDDGGQILLCQFKH